MISKIWQDFLTIIRQEVGSQMVETWLKAVSLLQWDAHEHVVYLEVPNSFVKDWLRNNYTSLFELHLRRLLNVDLLKIVFLDGQQHAQVKDSATVVNGSHSANGHDVVPHSKSEQTFTPARVVDNSTALAQRSNYRSTGHINGNYKFDSFVVGSSNQLAYAAACAVTEQPGSLYNPLFVYGDSGLGKTHLLHAIGNGIKQRDKHVSVLYQPADRFVNEFIHSIRFDKAHQFHGKYKDVDVLLIDDVQFIAHKDQTQEAFFHIFNALHDSHKQIVFSSDTYPQKLNGIAERLRSRLEWGLVADIQLPSLDTRIAILKKKAEVNNVVLYDDVAHFLASRAQTDIRALEGSLVHVLAVASLTRQPITLDLAKHVLVRPVQKTMNGTELDRIAQCVCNHYAFSIHDLRSNKKTKDIVVARQVAMYLMKKMTKKSLQEIGLFLGRKDHTTVIHALGKVRDTAQHSPDFSAHLAKIEEAIVQ